MPTLTKDQAARKLAKRLGVGIDRAEQLITKQDDSAVSWLSKEGITIKTTRETRNDNMLKNIGDLAPLLAGLWESTVKAQEAIARALDRGDAKNAGEYARTLQSVQKSFGELCEIKERRDAVTGETVPRSTVENILEDALPEFKRALDDLFVRLKSSLPKEWRAEVDAKWQAALPGYIKHLDATVTKLNRLLTPQS